MAFTSTKEIFDDLSHADTPNVISAQGQETVHIPSGEFLMEASFTREGADLVLTLDDGKKLTIEHYFDSNPPPELTSVDGYSLSPSLVAAFLQSSPVFAAAQTASDQSPIGSIDHIKGEAHIIHADGTRAVVSEGMKIYQGDVIETSSSGSLNITFLDQSSLSIGKNAKLALDEFVYDPEGHNGTAHVSFLRGLFLYTSGLIAGNDPDDVKIETPVGSIGIRGTIIAAEILPGGISHISVLEGAIVVQNSSQEQVLSSQYETVEVRSISEPIHHLGAVPAQEFEKRFDSLKDVSPSLFNMLHDLSQQSSSSHDTLAGTHDDSVDHTSSSGSDPFNAPGSISVISTGLNHAETGLPSHTTVSGNNDYSFLDNSSLTIPDYASTSQGTSMLAYTASVSQTGTATGTSSAASDQSVTETQPTSPQALENLGGQTGNANSNPYIGKDGYDDIFSTPDSTITRIDGKGGNDSLLIDQNTDLSGLSLNSIENIIIKNDSTQLTLDSSNLHDLLTTSDAGDVKISSESIASSTVLTLALSVGDSVTPGTPSGDGYTPYNVTYSSTPYTLYISNDIAVNIA